MKDKKIISYKSERVKKIAFNLRSLIRKAVVDKWMKLHREKIKNKSQAERIAIENERSYLYRALQASICECSSCRQVDKDMVYNAPLEEWYCTQCAQEYRDFYNKNKAKFGNFTEDDVFYETFL